MHDIGKKWRHLLFCVLYHAYAPRRKVMDDSGFALWPLFIIKKKVDVLPELLKKTIVGWWTSKTWMSPNKSGVTRKWLEPMVYDEKTMHFFMETQVTKVHLPEFFCFQICKYNSIFNVFVLKS